MPPPSSYSDHDFRRLNQASAKSAGEIVDASGVGKVLALSLIALVGASLSGCSFLPSAGPSSGEIRASAEQKDKAPPPTYQLIPITPKILAVLKNQEAAGSESGISTLASPSATKANVESLFRVTGINGLPLPPRQLVAAGDTLNITLYDSGGGLFGPLVPGGTASSPAPSTGSLTLPPQVVDEAGQITVPFAGRIQVLGRTTYEIEQDIVAKLKNKDINPQAVVTDTGHNGSNLVTVTGDVKTPLMMPIGLNGTRLLDALTAAGGSTGEAHQTTVTVIRGTDARTESLGDVFADLSKNILLKPGDTIVLRNHPWSYLVFGAVTKTGPYPFGSPDLNLADAMANSGGGLDNRGMLSIYLYRLEPTKFVRQMGLKPLNPSAPTTPIIYQLDLHSPQGFFLAQSFAIRNKDILYFPNADSVGVLKFLSILNALTAPIRSTSTTAVGFGAQ